MTPVSAGASATMPSLTAEGAFEMSLPQAYIDDPWFEALHERLRAEHAPATAIQSHLVWRLAIAIWRTERAARLEDQLLAGEWTAEKLRAVMRYQTQQQRETREVMELLAASEASRAVETAGQASKAPTPPQGDELDDLAGLSTRELLDELAILMAKDTLSEPGSSRAKRRGGRSPAPATPAAADHESARILPFIRRAEPAAG